MLNEPLAWRLLPCPVVPCLPRQHFVIAAAVALDDGTREGGEPILLGDEAFLVPLSSN